MGHAGAHCGALGPYPVQDFLVQLIIMNVAMVVFNLIPAFPMDGGRVLRSLLAMKLGQMRATEFAAHVSTFFALLMVVAFFKYPDFRSPFLIFVALFIWFAGRQELYGMRMRERLRRAEPIDVLPADDNMEYALTPPREPHYSGYTWNERLHAWVLWRDGRAGA